MFLRIGRYLMSDGYLIWIGFLVIAALLAGYFATWAHSLGIVAILFAVDYCRESYNRCPSRYRRRFFQ